MKITPEFLKTRPLSKSSLSEFAKSPAHYVHYLTAPRTTTDAFTFGGLVDCLILTPELYEERYVIEPTFSGTGMRAKQAEWREANQGKTFIDQTQLDDAMRMLASVQKNPMAKEILATKTSVQKCLRWLEDIEINGKTTLLPMIGYLDIESPHRITDLKTAVSADTEEFNRSAYNYGYHLQGAIYLRGYQKTHFKWPDFWHIVIEKKAPFGVNVLKADKDFLTLGEQQLDMLLKKFVYCMENDLWHESYQFFTAYGYNNMTLPGYAKQLIQK